MIQFLTVARYNIRDAMHMYTHKCICIYIFCNRHVLNLNTSILSKVSGAHKAPVTHARQPLHHSPFRTFTLGVQLCVGWLWVITYNWLFMQNYGALNHIIDPQSCGSVTIWLWHNCMLCDRLVFSHLPRHSSHNALCNVWCVLDGWVLNLSLGQEPLELLWTLYTIYSFV